MAFTGTLLTVDESTGFVESNYINSFDASRKVKFVELYQDSHNVRLCCRTIGINRQTFAHHYDHDEAFRKAILEAREGVCDDLEQTAVMTAKTPEGVRDRWRILETYRPEVWAKKDTNTPQIVINLDARALEAFETKEKAIEAQIVKDT